MCTIILHKAENALNINLHHFVFQQFDIKGQSNAILSLHCVKSNKDVFVLFNPRKLPVHRQVASDSKEVKGENFQHYHQSYLCTNLVARSWN